MLQEEGEGDTFERLPLPPWCSTMHDSNQVSMGQGRLFLPSFNALFSDMDRLRGGIFEAMTSSRSRFFAKFIEGGMGWDGWEKTFLLAEEDVYITPVKKYSRNRCPSFSNILRSCSSIS